MGTEFVPTLSIEGTNGIFSWNTQWEDPVGTLSHGNTLHFEALGKKQGYTLCVGMYQVWVTL